MTTKDEWVEQKEFDKAADEIRAEKGGDLRKVNANMVATRMGRKKANATFYRMFDDWQHRRRVQTHVPPFEVHDRHREMLENVLITVGTEVSAEAAHNAGFRNRDLQEENDSLRGDRNDLLTMLDERDAALETANQHIDDLNRQLEKTRAANAVQASKIGKLEGRIFELQSATTSFNDPVAVRKLADLIATAVADNNAKQACTATADTTLLANTSKAIRPKPAAEEHPDLLGQISSKSGGIAAGSDRKGVDMS